MVSRKKKLAGKRKVRVGTSRTKAEIVAHIAEATGLTKKAVSSVLEAMMTLIEKYLGPHGPGVFTIPGLLKIKRVRKPHRSARMIVNPSTGAKMTLKARPEHNEVVITPLKNLSDAVALSTAANVASSHIFICESSFISSRVVAGEWSHSPQLQPEEGFKDGSDWQAFPLLKCPGTMVVSKAFRLEVGLAPEQQEGVEGDALSLPHPIEGPYQLDIDLIADGFMLAGESTHTRRQLVVSQDTPYPSVVVEAVAERGNDLVSRRSIIALFSVVGRPCGTASRTVTVVAEAALPVEGSPAEDAAVAGFDESILASGVAADLTIKITEGNRDHPGTLLWTLVSPHDVTLKPDKSKDRFTDIGAVPAEFAKNLLEQAAMMSGRPLYDHLKGIGMMHIAPKIPDWVIGALREVVDIIDQRPTVLIASHEPHVPWELAVCEPPIRDACHSPFLGAQVVLGRWIPGPKNRPPTAPSKVELDVRAMAVIGCKHYGKLSGFGRLLEAEQEVEDLLTGGEARHAIDGIHKRVIACLDGDPPAEVIHFALHGMFDHPVYGSGLVLVAEDSTEPGYHLEMLTPEQVAIRNLPNAPFVFLNACQVGAGEVVLGDYGGLVKSFLFAGACAVIAPLWKIDDGVARDIAVRFYGKVFEGNAPAEFIRQERANFTGDANQSGTYLAYQFFGHPAFIMRDTLGD